MRCLPAVQRTAHMGRKNAEFKEESATNLKFLDPLRGTLPITDSNENHKDLTIFS